MRNTLNASDRRHVTRWTAGTDRIARVELALRVVLARITRRQIDVREPFDAIVRRWVKADGVAAVFGTLTRRATKRETLLTLDAMYAAAKRDVVYRSLRNVLAA